MLQEIFDQFTCNICYEEYKSEITIPVITCTNFHIICGNCLTNIMFYCPFCKESAYRFYSNKIQFKKLFEIKKIACSIQEYKISAQQQLNNLKEQKRKLAQQNSNLMDQNKKLMAQNSRLIQQRKEKEQIFQKQRQEISNALQKKGIKISKLGTWYQQYIQISYSSFLQKLKFCQLVSKIQRNKSALDLKKTMEQLNAKLLDGETKNLNIQNLNLLKRLKHWTYFQQIFMSKPHNKNSKNTCLWDITLDPSLDPQKVYQHNESFREQYSPI